MKQLIFIVLVIFSFISCGDNSGDITTPEELLEQYNNFKKEITSSNNSAIITLERTACFGTCPIYSLSIYENGKTKYFGLEYVEQTGLHQSNISESDLNFLVSFALDNGYSDLQNEYRTIIDTAEDGTPIVLTVSDLPTKITSLVINGNRKIVENYFGAPEWLSSFENKIDSITNVGKWIGK
ncbi:MAG: DUF6438 domain-containing protein [Ignavibacteria bacterium]|jgi:hypothetical protein